MEQLLHRELGCSTVKAVGLSGGGCISEGQSYSTDSGTVFAKTNHKSQVLHYKEKKILYTLHKQANTGEGETGL